MPQKIWGPVGKVIKGREVSATMWRVLKGHGENT
jgi:hypothetical protein